VPVAARHLRAASVASRPVSPWIRSTSILVLCLLGFLSWTVAFGQSQRFQSTLNSSTTPIPLQGRIVNAVTGLPIPRVLVRLNSRAVLTDHEGKFFFDQVTDAAVNLQITKPGFSASADPFDAPSLFLRMDQLTGPVEFRLYPEALLTGTVMAPDGEPIPRASVLARRSTFDDQGHHWQIIGQSQTDLHGDFRIPVSAADYRVETRYLARNNGERDAILPVSSPPSASAQAIHLSSGQEQHVELRPAVRRTYPVLLGIESGTDRGFPMITAHTSDGGSFNIGVIPTRTPGHANLYLPTGTYRLSARIQNPESIEIAETSVTVTGAEQLIADASITPTAGTILRFVTIAAIPVEVSADSASTSATSNSGSQSASRSTGPISISQSGQQSTGPNATQFGLSLQRIDPSDDDQQSNLNLVHNPRGTTGFTAPPGTYRLMSRGYGQWYIRSATYGSSDLIGHTLTIAAGASGATIHLVASNQTGSLQGSVKLKSQPASGSWIYLINNAASLTPTYTLRANVDGTFTNPFLPPGTYQAIAFERRHSVDLSDPASLAPYSTWVQAVTITAGGQMTTNLNAVPETEVQP
jgi:hypothetical protein